MRWKRLKIKMSELFDRFVFVGKCPACREMLPYELRDEAFCKGCRPEWDKAKVMECSTCGKAICECVCMTSALERSGALCHHKAVKYSSESPIVHNTMMFLKRNKNPRVAGFLASQLVSVMYADEELPELTADNTLVTFVPRGRKAVLTHGFDQAELISKAFAEKMGFEMRRTIRRSRGGREQKRLNANDRAKNVKRIFEADGENISHVRDKYVILIDDIVTTGASMAACVSLLVRARAGAVICLSVAYTEKTRKRNK